MNAKFAAAQIDARVGDIVANADRHAEVAERAARAGARVVVFPELSLTGYTVRDLAWDLALDPRTDRRLAGLRRLSKKVSIALGLIESGADHGIYNSAVFLEGGEVLHVHRKVYLPTYGMFEEGRYFSQGDAVSAFTSKHGRIGMLVCEDMWHAALPYVLGVDGAEVILSLTASPTRVGSDPAELDTRTVNHEHQRVFARLLSLYTVFSNRVGFEDGVNFWGGSLIVGPDGRPLASGALFEEGVIQANLDSREIRRARRFSRHVLDDRPELIRETLRLIRRSRT